MLADHGSHRASARSATRVRAAGRIPTAPASTRVHQQPRRRNVLRRISIRVGEPGALLPHVSQRPRLEPLEAKLQFDRLR
jgi:hypothetical protein